MFLVGTAFWLLLIVAMVIIVMKLFEMHRMIKEIYRAAIYEHGDTRGS
jgi:hypothetical protein